MSFIQPPAKRYDPANDAVFRRALEREIGALKRATAEAAAIPDAVIGTEVATINAILALLRERGFVAR